MTAGSVRAFKTHRPFRSKSLAVKWLALTTSVTEHTVPKKKNSSTYSTPVILPPTNIRNAARKTPLGMNIRCKETRLRESSNTTHFIDLKPIRPDCEARE